MKVFISINNLECGGAQKSLISLLNYLKVSNGMDIDLLVLDESDVFFKDIPDWIHVLEASDEVKAMFMPFGKLMGSEETKMPIRYSEFGKLGDALFRFKKKNMIWQFLM